MSTTITMPIERYEELKSLVDEYKMIKEGKVKCKEMLYYKGNATYSPYSYLRITSADDAVNKIADTLKVALEENKQLKEENELLKGNKKKDFPEREVYEKEMDEYSQKSFFHRLFVK